MTNLALINMIETGPGMVLVEMSPHPKEHQVLLISKEDRQTTEMIGGAIKAVTEIVINIQGMTEEVILIGILVAMVEEIMRGEKSLAILTEVVMEEEIGVEILPQETVTEGIQPDSRMVEIHMTVEAWISLGVNGTVSQVRPPEIHTEWIHRVTHIGIGQLIHDEMDKITMAHRETSTRVLAVKVTSISNIDLTIEESHQEQRIILGPQLLHQDLRTLTKAEEVISREAYLTPEVLIRTEPTTVCTQEVKKDQLQTTPMIGIVKAEELMLEASLVMQMHPGMIPEVMIRRCQSLWINVEQVQ